MARSAHRQTRYSRRNRRLRRQEPIDELDLLSDDELEDILFEEDETRPQGPFNFPTMAGLSLILIGLLYLMQQLNVLSGFSLTTLMSWLPWIAGCFVVLLGFGILSRRPQRSRRKRRKELRRRRQRGEAHTTRVQRNKRRLTKSLHRKVAGVCGGLAEHFDSSATYIRLAFIVGTFFTSAIGPIFPIGYAVLAFVLPRHEDDKNSNSSAEPPAKVDKREIRIYK